MEAGIFCRKTLFKVVHLCSVPAGDFCLHLFFYSFLADNKSISYQQCYPKANYYVEQFQEYLSVCKKGGEKIGSDLLVEYKKVTSQSNSY